MVLLYDRVLMEKVIEEEFSNGIIKHYLSHDEKAATFLKGIVRQIGMKCEEVKVGDVVLYKGLFDRTIEVDGKKYVEIRESNIEGILSSEDVKIGECYDKIKSC